MGDGVAQGVTTVAGFAMGELGRVTRGRLHCARRGGHLETTSIRPNMGPAHQPTKASAKPIVSVI